MRKVLMILLQAALVEALSKVTGYVGESAVLPSGAAQSETLTEVEWSVFNNNTLIATCSKGEIKVEWFYQFKGRLHLNNTSGDLTISKLMLSDAMVYKVDRLSAMGFKVQEVELVVRERLQPPAITTVACPSSGGRYFALLQCSSPDEDVAFSWDVGAPVEETSNFTAGPDVFLLAIISSAQGNVQISCSARRHSDHASSSTTTDCRRESPTRPPTLPPPTVTPQEESCPSKCREGLFFFLGSLFAGLLVLGKFSWNHFQKR